jgi:nicotinate-nucleotide adenylyltransferase
LAFADFLPAHAVSEIEKDLPTPSYSYATVTAIQKLYPTKRLAWVIGLDQLQNFHRWVQGQELLKIASLLVMRRDDLNFEQIVAKLAVDLQLSAPLRGLYELDCRTTPAASRKIREAIKDGLPVDPAWLSSGIRNYIDHEKLYRGHV